MSAADNPQNDNLDRAKRYSSIKYSLAIIETLYILLLLAIFAISGLSKALAGYLRQSVPNSFFLVLPYFLICYLAYYLLSLPLNFFQSFLLEHRFSLSRQNLRGWLSDQFKGGIIFYTVSIIGLEAFYFTIVHQPRNWWWQLAIFWILFSFILARLVPVLIIPLFFKYCKLTDESLRQRIIALSSRMKIKILDVFEIDLSKKTVKVNAGLVGWGKTRRVILADTLKEKYSDDEIEIILAHEFAHYQQNHLIKMVAINALATAVCFYIIFFTSSGLLRFCGQSSLSDIAALPIVFGYLVLFGIFTQPIENYFSRRFEIDADLLALKSCGMKEAFISTMNKFAEQNLADRNPHPLIKLFFFDHPPIDERISYARNAI